MIFGKIDYINLLPFHVYLKSLPLQSSFKKSIEYKKGVPNQINKKLYKGQIDAAIISSVESKKRAYKTLNLGIIAHKRVDSVLVKKNSKQKPDTASATSNALAKVLDEKGEVIIGDRALKAFLQSPEDYVDLVTLWHEKTSLPFVFARLCVRKHFGFYKKISKSFLSKNIKIPRYILQKYSNSRGIDSKDIQNYLKLIHYDIKTQEARALKKFLKEAKKNM